MSFRDFSDLLEEEASSPRGKDLAVKPLILVIDDDEMIRRSLHTVLGTRYEVRASASAMEGLSALTEDVCVVILDVKMHGQDGFWACMQIRKRYPELPVIFYSAYQNLKDPYDIINECHPFGYVTKDGNTRKLSELVESAVKTYRTKAEYKRTVENIRRGRQEIEQSLRRTSRPPPPPSPSSPGSNEPPKS